MGMFVLLRRSLNLLMQVSGGLLVDVLFVVFGIKIGWAEMLEGMGSRRGVAVNSLRFVSRIESFRFIFCLIACILKGGGSRHAPMAVGVDGPGPGGSCRGNGCY